MNKKVGGLPWLLRLNRVKNRTKKQLETLEQTNHEKKPISVMS